MQPSTYSDDVNLGGDTGAKRIKSRAAADETGLSLWQVQHMAGRGEIPGAAKLGSLWTFDKAKLRRWISHRESVACPTISTNAAALGTDEFRSEGARYEKAYERAFS